MSQYDYEDDEFEEVIEEKDGCEDYGVVSNEMWTNQTMEKIAVFDDNEERTLSRTDKKTVQKNKSSSKMWARHDNSYFACQEAVKTMPAGQYLIRRQNDGSLYFQHKEIQLDNVVKLTDSDSRKVIDAIEHFWNKEEAYKEMGFLWKRGVLLWGPPGSGKTTTLQELAQNLIDDDGIVIYCDSPIITAYGLQLLRKIEPQRKVIVLLEDIDAIIQNHGEPDLLALLDGELQIDRCVFIATTNYPEKLDRRLTNRPSRFDLIQYIGMPNETDREIFIRAKAPQFNDDEVKEIVQKSEGFSVAHLKEIMISVCCLEKSIDETVEHLKKMKTSNISSDDYMNDEGGRRSIGFATNDY